MAADIVLNATAVAEVVTYVAPGYLFFRGYRLRFPGPDRPAGEVLIVSVVSSLPLVALASLLRGVQKPTHPGYVALLLGGALALGYSLAFLRGTQRVKSLLDGLLDYRMEPEGTIYSHTLAHLGADIPSTVELTDGRLISGCVRNGPQHKDDGINELYIVYPEARDADGNWVSIGGQGLIVPLTQVCNIVLSQDPTGAPKSAPKSSTDNVNQNQLVLETPRVPATAANADGGPSAIHDEPPASRAV